MRAQADRISDHTGYRLVKVGHVAAAAFDEALAPLGMRPRHVMVLEAIRGGTLSQQDLCQLTGMDRTTMVAVVDELERLGYAHRERSAADRRKHVVKPTAAGESAFEEAARALLAAEEALLGPLSAAERDSLGGLVAKLFEAAARRPG
ncbi:MarR family winged helix-turn-helix transcriptional regulator [Thermoactinospora rubra]|uniref:MarR family winged helix-turn-helix transcriptional regulator n=1 Tax=Thermoactinospora rubra TaxID=1088767 RepID=UPI000A0FA874|nr:MarR family winged helix-turn-helix transcriptional regulator [Thermoactinospora rubra]